MSQLNDYRLEWGKLFRKIEFVQDEARTEHELEQKLMRDRPEIFPVQILRVPSWEELNGTGEAA